MKTLTSKTAILILGVIVAIAIIFSNQSAIAGLGVKKDLSQIEELPVSAFEVPTHLLKMR